MSSTLREGPTVTWGRHVSKLGEGIFGFSLPAKTTCPSATTICLLVCYALRGRFRTKAHVELYARNFRVTATDAFIRMAIRALGFVKVLRIHVSGDFYDVDYVRRWIAICSACPHTQFFAYTRSWKEGPAMLDALVEFSRLPNVSLWFSEDRDTAGRAPYVPGVRVAFLVHGPEDNDLVPAYADLVFRTSRHRRVAFYDRPLKRISGILVCPAEQWWRWSPRSKRKKPPHITCSMCGICVTRRPSRRDGST